MAAFSRAVAQESVEVALLEGLAALGPVAIDLAELNEISTLQSRELLLLNDAGNRISSSLYPAEVCDALIEAIWNHFRPQATGLYLYNDDNTNLLLAAGRGLHGEVGQIAADNLLIARAVQQASPIVANEESMQLHLPGILGELPCRSAMVAPLAGHGQQLGVVLALSAASDTLTVADTQMMTTLLSQAGVALRNAFQVESDAIRTREIATLYDLAEELAASRSVSAVLEVVAKKVESLLQVDLVVILTYDRRTDFLIPAECRGENCEGFGGYRAPINAGIPGWIYQWLVPMSEPDVAGSNTNAAAPLPFGASVVGVPLTAKDDNGVLLAISNRRRVFSTGERQLLETIGRSAALALESAMLYRHVQEKGNTTRRYFARVAKLLGRRPEEGLTDDLLDLIADMMEADRCAVYAVRGTDLQCVAQRHFRTPLPTETSSPLTLTGWVARYGRALVVENLEEDPRGAHHAGVEKEGLVSYVGVPLKLKSQRRVIGVLEIFSRTLRIYKPSEIKVLKDFVQHARLAEQLADKEGPVAT